MCTALQLSLGERSSSEAAPSEPGAWDWPPCWHVPLCKILHDSARFCSVLFVQFPGLSRLGSAGLGALVCARTADEPVLPATKEEADQTFCAVNTRLTRTFADPTCLSCLPFLPYGPTAGAASSPLDFRAGGALRPRHQGVETMRYHVTSWPKCTIAAKVMYMSRTQGGDHSI